jgi:dTDP-4-dehydrorhamnose 3,5-epimerase
MIIKETGIKDLIIIEPKIFADIRGYFFESYNKDAFFKAGININFVQDNQSKSEYGVIRGLHFQNNPHSQTKLVRVLAGKIFDVAVDLRKGSSTFGKWFGVEISDSNQIQLLIPKGFAHGFSVLSEKAIVLYKCDDFYHPESESGIIYNDPKLNIDWKIPTIDAKVSSKDAKLPLMKPSIYNF